MKNILKIKIEKPYLLVLAVIVLAGAVFSVIQLTTASPAVPNPGHSYGQIELPAGVWTGLDADKVDGKHANELFSWSNSCGRFASLCEPVPPFIYLSSCSVTCPTGYRIVGQACDGFNCQGYSMMSSISPDSKTLTCSGDAGSGCARFNPTIICCKE